LSITRRQGVEYLDAYCLIDNRRKLFRLDLIRKIL
jgi:predicted DNA-binding transcriptional regulator YafY